MKHPHFTRKSVMAFAGGLAALLAASHAGAQTGFNPFGVFTDSGPVSQEEKARREKVRTDLYDRLRPALRMDLPFVSEAAIASLEHAIVRYQQIVGAGGWPVISGAVTLRAGDTNPVIASIRQRLVLEGDLHPEAGNGATFDAAFQDGLARFQIRNGLRVSGFVDQRTLRTLNVPAAERLRQLQANLPRLHELLATVKKSPRYVLVNVPSYTAQAVENGHVALDSGVVVGKPQRATPTVTARIIEVNFFPTWSVPDTVARNDLIPAIRKDPNYFYEQRFNVMRDWGTPPLDPQTVDWASPQVISYKFRQDPGPQNALGLVRINMPNKHAVYMHDTPLKSLFGQSARAFSSGCVRVERVYDLVAWLLGEQPGWDYGRVLAQADSGEKLDVKLKQAVPVHFVYLTAFAARNGVAQFRPDIYGRDASSGDGLDDLQDAVVAQQSRAITP
jgi:murein L,D-transpeptidase YcbB/YkuD